MGTRWTAKYSDVFSHTFTCSYCAFSGSFLIPGKASGSGSSQAEAQRLAVQWAREDAEQKTRIARCPQCRRRNGKAVGWFFGKILIWSTILTVFFWLMLTRVERMGMAWPFLLGGGLLTIGLLVSWIRLWGASGGLLRRPGS